MKRGLLALAALVTVLVAAFVAWGDGPGDVERLSGSPQHTASSGPADVIATDALAASPAASAPSERRALDPRFAPVQQSVATSGGARRWSELLAPIDFATRAPIADATLVFFDASGARRERPLDGPIDMRDLRPGVLGIVDAPTHVARPFLPDDFASHAPGPLTVELRPSAALHIVADMSIDLSQRPIEYSIESGYDGGASGSDEDRAAIDVSRRLRELQYGELDAAARAQRVAALTVRREPAALPLFDLARTPDPSFGAQTRLTFPDRLPWMIDDLPTGVQVDVQVRLARGLRVGRDGDFRALDELRSLYLEPASTSRLAIERDQFGTVRGRLDNFAPGPHAIWLVPEDAAPNAHQAIFAAGPTGEFQIEFVMPGRRIFNAHWTTTSGSVAEYVLDIDVPAERILDLGVLRTDAELERHTLTIRPHVTIDGLEADLVRDHRLRESTWAIEVRHANHMAQWGGKDEPLRRVRSPMGEAAVIDDLLPGRYVVKVAALEHAPRVERLVFGTDNADMAELIAFSGDMELPVDVALRSLWRTTFRFVHHGAAPLPPLDLSVRRRGRADLDAFDRDAFSISIADGSPQVHALDEGTWVAEVHAATLGTVEAPVDRSQRLVAWSGFDAGETDDEVVELRLVAACALELSWIVVDAHPKPEQGETIDLLSVLSNDQVRAPQPRSPDPAYIVFEDLLPDTEYTIHPLGRTFRTGAPGSVTRIDA